MSLASDYATACAAVEASEPASWNGSRLVASVTDDGQCRLIVDGSLEVVAPGALLLAFATWVNATFS